MIPSRYLGALLIFIAASGYATVAIFGKLIFEYNLPMTTVLSWRFGGAALLLWLLVRFQKESKLTLRQNISCLMIGLTGDVLQTALFILAVARVGASTAALLLYTFPLFVFLIQRYFFRVLANKKQWVALFMASCGAALVINPFHSRGALNGAGVFLGIGAAIISACYLSVSAHFTKGIAVAAASLRLTTGAFIGFTLIALFQGGLSLPSGRQEWFLCGGFILIATFIPLLSLIKGMQLIGASQAAILFTIEPVVTIVLAVLLFGESLTLANGMGCLLILSSTIWVQQRKGAPIDQLKST